MLVISNVLTQKEHGEICWNNKMVTASEMFRKCDKTNNTKQREGQCSRHQVSRARDDGY